MKTADLFNFVQSGVCRISVNLGNYVASGSGFIVGNKIVTCGHVYLDLPQNSHVEISFSGKQTFIIPKSVIDSSVKALSDHNGYDYCVLELAIDLSNNYQFEFCSRDAKIGETVLALGFPFGQTHLSIHKGIISASYKSGVAGMLQLDMSVNPANSGGPLINEDGEVIAVICRKATGLTSMFEQLQHSSDANQRLLTAASGRMFISGIDPLALGAAIQRQMEQISKEISRSANVGIGYAISVNELRNEQSLVNNSQVIDLRL